MDPYRYRHQRTLLFGGPFLLLVGRQQRWLSDGRVAFVFITFYGGNWQQ
jgi:hypothetical protein